MDDKVKFDLVRASRDKAFVAARYLKEGKLDLDLEEFKIQEDSES